MPIYKVTTEADCEGRSTKTLGYVEANSPEHAIKYFESIGKHAYYEYWVDEVENLIVKATPEDQLHHLVADMKPAYGGSWRGIVKTDAEAVKEKERQVAEVLRHAGLSVEDVIKFGGQS